MEIKLNTNIESVGRVAGSQPKKLEAKTEEQTPSFDRSEALNDALRQTPDVRSEVVANAKKAVGNSSYPPSETIRKIAVLLAKNIDPES
jgi:hypothetical protein